MDLKEKDKLLLLYEETTNLIQESNKICKDKLAKLDNILQSKLLQANKVIKEHNIDIKKFKSWINELNKNEQDIKIYSNKFEQINDKLSKNFSLNEFENHIQEQTIIALNEQYNVLKTIQIREEKQKKDLDEITKKRINSVVLTEKLEKIVNFYENITGIRIEKDVNESDVFIVHAFEGYNLLNDLKSCDFHMRYKNKKFYIIKMNPEFNPKPYEDEINGTNLEYKNLGIIIGKIILNEFPKYVIT